MLGLLATIDKLVKMPQAEATLPLSKIKGETLFGELLALKWREKFGLVGDLQVEIAFGLGDFLVQMAKKS